MGYVGMNNWENVHSFSGVCKQWRILCLPHSSKIGITPMDGGENRTLNINAFLNYLTLEKFRNMQCILFPVEEQRVCWLMALGECAHLFGQLCIATD